MPEERDEDMVEFAALKLVNGEVFSPRDKYHVFAALSQRLCLDPVLTGSEALELADRSVAHHMRLLTGFSATGDICHTHTPSEPILALGSAHLLYDQSETHCWARVLSTFSHDLCSAGLIEKGILGELSARTLLLIARDFAAPQVTQKSQKNLLKPVGVLEFLHHLFGHDSWAAPDDQSKFENAFRNAHVNFTHWMVTKDPMPKESTSTWVYMLYDYELYSPDCDQHANAEVILVGIRVYFSARLLTYPGHYLRTYGLVGPRCSAVFIKKASTC